MSGWGVESHPWHGGLPPRPLTKWLCDLAFGSCSCLMLDPGVSLGTQHCLVSPSSSGFFWDPVWFSFPTPLHPEGRVLCLLPRD